MRREGERVEKPVTMTCLGSMSFIALFLDLARSHESHGAGRVGGVMGVGIVYHPVECTPFQLSGWAGLGSKESR